MIHKNSNDTATCPLYHTTFFIQENRQNPKRIDKNVFESELQMKYWQRSFPILPILSATLHLYNFRLWSNYPSGTENAFFGKCFRPKKAKERSTTKNNNQINVPQAREAMDRFTMLIRSEAGINLANSYNSHLPPPARPAPSAARWTRECYPHKARDLREIIGFLWAMCGKLST